MINDVNGISIDSRKIKENVVFFPSEVYHRVEQNDSGNVRYSLSFNIMPKGTIQEVDMSDSIITLVDYFAMFKK